MKESPIVTLKDISKKYIVHHERPTFLESIINGSNEEFWALKNINLRINKGERVGIVGPNGSGKTTLLKIITGITTPTSGEVRTEGKIVSLIDLEAGFHPEMTGIQNIFLNGMIVGMTKDEIEIKLSKIIAFAGIGKFIDTPLYTYSSGMKLRLGFAIAAHSEPDIILLDENMAVGDSQFQEKSRRKIREFCDRGVAAVIATHSLTFLESMCKRAILLQKGKICLDSSAREIVRLYG